MAKRLFGSVLIAFIAYLTSLNAQDPFPGIQHSTGQDVSPMYNGWARNSDGTYTMYFGYLNRNSEEAIDVPLGPDNFFDLGNGDHGQPTHFLPGAGNRARQLWVFGVVLPKDWPKDKRLVWTLKNRGRTNQAKGWLQPEWEVVKDGMRLGDYRAEFQQGDTSQQVPSISVTAGPAQTITFPATATLTATATTVGIDRGVRIQWIHYRGPGNVQFDAAVNAAAKSNPVMAGTKVTFSAPGEYRIRVLATDGQWFSTYDVDVNVKR
jgi:hypothetical protein